MSDFVAINRVELLLKKELKRQKQELIGEFIEMFDRIDIINAKVPDVCNEDEAFYEMLDVIAEERKKWEAMLNE